jgi:hypothetical protein
VQIRAICDIRPDNLAKAQAAVEKSGRERPAGYSKNEESYLDLVARGDLDGVIIATPWQWHIRIAIAAMKAGKYAGMEVAPASSVEECWDLVKAHEETGVPCMFLENWVNSGSPARPREVIHFYGSGWGPVDRTVQTGQPTSSDRIYRITLPCRWRATGASTEPSSESSFEEAFAGLAPGLVGVYQLDLRIPPDWDAPVFDVFCTWSSGSNAFSAETAAIEVRP